MPKPLTSRQGRVLKDIGDFIQIQGYSPSVRQLAACLGISSATTQGHLDALERKGQIRRTGQKNGIVLLKPEEHIVDRLVKFVQTRPEAQIKGFTTADTLRLREGLKGIIKRG